MNPALLPVAGLAGVAVLLLVPARPRPPGPVGSTGASRSSGAPVSPPGRSTLLRLRPLLAAVGALGGWALTGGTWGFAAAVVCGVAVWVVLGRAEDPAAVRRRERLLEDLPVGVDLLAACLDAGGSPEGSLLVVADALGGPVGEELAQVHHRLEMGVDPAQVWRGVAEHPQLGPLGRAVGRAHESGASVSRAVQQLGVELRERAHAEVETRARSIEVRTAAPLGLCLLPAFVVLGVVPLVAGVFGSMRLFG
ncbi:MAG: type secretion system protein [Marmoricola sp.]|nr:type secretion system protein [Marmoricola sp.]